MEESIDKDQMLFKQNIYQEAIDTCDGILATDIPSTEAIKNIYKTGFY